jgi:hypothetical protein
MCTEWGSDIAVSGRHHMPPPNAPAAGRSRRLMQRHMERVLTVAAIVAVICIGVSLYMLFGIALA